MKNNLLILFGEYRTFETAINQLHNLDKCDIVFTTWDVSENWKEENGYTFCVHDKITEQKITDINPNIKPLVVPRNDVYHQKYNFKKMVFHWKNSLNQIENIDKYERIILHRCDMASNYHLLLEENFDEDTLYIEYGEMDEEHGFWVNDYIICGKYYILKKFVDSLNYDDLTINHFPIGNTILKNNIKYEQINNITRERFGTQIIKNKKFHLDYFKKLNKLNLKFTDLEVGSELWEENFTSHDLEVPPSPQ